MSWFWLLVVVAVAILAVLSEMDRRSRWPGSTHGRRRRSS
jgi:hypothetical protein